MNHDREIDCNRRRSVGDALGWDTRGRRENKSCGIGGGNGEGEQRGMGAPITRVWKGAGKAMLLTTPQNPRLVELRLRHQDRLES